MKLDESVSASKASMDTVSENLDDIERVLDWSVRYEKDRVMITTVLNGVELYFNPCSRKVEDVMGRDIWYAYRTLVFYPWRRTSGGQLGHQR